MGVGNSKSIAVLGDSITNGYYDEEGLGWIARLSILLNKDEPNSYIFCNHAVGGDRIYDVKYRLFSSVERYASSLIIAVGVNDTYVYVKRDAPPVLYMGLREEIWNDVLAFAKKLVPQVFVFGILPVDEARVPARVSNYGEEKFFRNDYIVDYNERIKGWCEHHDVPHINFHQRFLDTGHVRLLADDVHPNAEGMQLLAQWAYEELKGKI